jgi:hypothetical protein
MTGSIKISNYDKGLSGHYFAAGWDPNASKWYSFSNNQWVQYDGTETTLLSMPTANLQDRAALTLFNQTNLAPFPLGKIYLGYGIGATKLSAWNNMMSNLTQYGQCGTLPGIPVVKSDVMSCPLTGALTAKTMTASISVGTANQTKPGYYFIAAKLAGSEQLYLFKDGVWSLYNGSASTLAGYASTGNLSQFSKLVFSNTNLSVYKGAEIFIGYGVGSTIGSAFAEMIAASPSARYKSCGTIQ